jgi:hypothetical protein
LGFGVLSSVSPASAVGANDNITAITAGTSAPARIGVSSGTTTITLTHPETATPAYDETVTAQITSAPATSANAALTFSTNTTNPMTNTPVYTASTKTDWATAGMAGIASAFGRTSTVASAKTTNITLNLNADVAGSYTFLVSTVSGAPTVAAATYAAGDANATAGGGFTAGKISTFYTITTAGTPTVLTATTVAGAVTTAGLGQIFSLSMKDAAGNATILGLQEAISISDDSIATTLYKEIGASNSTLAAAFGSADVNVAGAYYVRSANTGTLATGTAVLTFAGSGLLASSLTVNVTETLQATTTALTSSTVACTTATNCTGVSPNFSTSGAQSLTFTNTAAFGLTTAATYHQVAVIASGLYYSSFATVALNATTASLTAAFTAPAPSTGKNTSVTLGGVTAVMAYVAATASTIAVSGSASVLSATGSARNHCPALTWAL